MPIEIGMALKLLGGAPHLKAAITMAEKLPIARVLSGGPLGNILSQVLQNGPGALMQNPIAALSGQLQGAMSAAASALGSVSGAAGLVSAITGSGGLSSAISSLSSAADMLSGVVTPGAGQFGLLDVVTHSSITDMLGSALPFSMSLTPALGPLNAAAQIGQITTGLNNMVSAVSAGTMAISDATNWVAAQTAAVTGVTSASATAFQSAQDAAQALVSISSAASILASNNPTLQILLPMITQPATLVAMRAGIASHVA